ncbi:MAG: CpaF family protein [Solirubrobacteraceae bacterium]|nr:CpaF family protein [Solirubrobacteraceae bacterium]
MLAPLATALHRRLLDAPSGDAPGEPLEVLASRLTDAHVPLLRPDTRARLAAAVVRRAAGLGPLEPLLADPQIDEIMVSGCTPIWVERAGRIETTGSAFPSEEALREVVDRILSPLGRRIDAAEPLVDARLPDGSRVHVAIPPVALDGTAVTIRRFRAGGRTIDELVADGSWEPAAAELLRRAVAGRRTVLVCGATGAGKTTVLGALARELPPAERIVTIEDAAELRLGLPHVIRLECRPANLEGEGTIAIRDLVRASLRMRPDRIVVGEVRGGEALDLLLALSSGHAGGLSTIHAGSPAEALRRLELLALLAGTELPHAAARALALGSIDLVAHQARLADGRRVLREIAEVDPEIGAVTVYLREEA